MSKILIVENEVNSARVLRMFLEESGHEVQLAVDAPGALRISKSFTPDILLSDYLLSGSMDGLQLASRLSERFEGLRVYLMTGLPETEVTRPNPCCSFTLLSKPLDLAMLETEFEKKTQSA